MLAILIAAILAVCLCLANVASTVSKDDVNYRLPLYINPVNYKIIIKPYLNEADPKKFTFDGECDIEIQTVQKTQEIQLHIKNLNISVSEYYRKGTTKKTKLPIATPNSLTSIVVYKLKEFLQPNVSYILHYKYVGSMDVDMHGFYRSYYTTSENVTRWLGATQLAPHYARRVFPSFDEPKFKSTFDLSITRHRTLRSTGPTRISLEIKPFGEYTIDVYKTTPKMSTYQLAFIVSDFNDRSDGEFSFLARREFYSQTEYGFDYGKKLLRALGDYLDMPYHSFGNDVMQMAAIPDFSGNAMANWGLLTGKEQAILYDREHSSLKFKQSIAAIVAHEQIHMWFGNLVTSDWWNYHWLNKGLARYFQCFGADLVESNMNVEQQFVVDFLQNVMELDATSATNPMSNEYNSTEANMKLMLNSITENKGASFIRMTKHILGEDNFRKSLIEYLKTHQYSSTVPASIFTVWKKYWPYEYIHYANNYFASFITQVSFPVVTFNRISEATVQVSQKLYLLKKKANPNSFHTVPITYTTSDKKDFQNTAPKFILEKTPVTVSVNKDVKWLVGNIQETGYYRVNYDNQTWHQIKEALYADNWSGIHEMNRAQIVDDVLNLARAGEIDYSLAFAVVGYIKNETNYLPWASVFKAFSYINKRLGIDNQDLARYVHYITSKTYQKLAFDEKENDTPFDIYTRGEILAWSCKYNKLECIFKAKSYFSNNLKKNPIPVNIRPVVYCTAMRYGNERDFDNLCNKYKTETVATEIPVILSSLGCVKDSRFVSRFFHMIISPEIRLQDKNIALTSLYTENNENVELVFDLLEQNVKQLSHAFGGYSDVASVVFNIAERFTTESQLKKLKAFNIKHKDKFDGSATTLRRAVKLVEFNLNWSKAQLESIKTFLYQHGQSHGQTSKEILVPIPGKKYSEIFFS